jgi:DNA-binding GntR family transcriptional regulator
MPIPSQVPRIERQLMRERVYATLREWILEGTLQPNETLRDTELASRLGVSRTPLREALRRLEDEGLVQTAAHRWTRVAPLDVAAAERIYPVVGALESLAMQLAGPRLTDEDLAVMERANSRLRSALKRREAVEASKADREFHGVYVQRTLNPELIQILEWLKAKLRRIEVVYFGGTVVAEASAEEHDRVLRALRRRDYPSAVREVQGNWSRSLQRLRAYLAGLKDAGSLPTRSRNVARK